ncbi:MAG: NUDIX hydrolase [Clostridia bacterium]|nr:NUDIX hydrolase [Clostridia bacterium]
MELYEKTLEKNYVYEGKIINVRKDKAAHPDGTECTREVVEHNGGVCVAPLTNNNELIFVRQFRYPYGEVVLELPAGKLEKGEPDYDAGKRELEEETGHVAGEYHKIGVFYPTPGYCGEVIHLYVAWNLTETQMNPDEGEFLEVERIPLDRAVDMVMNGEIPDGKTQTLIMRVAEMKRRGIIGGGNG